MKFSALIALVYVLYACFAHADTVRPEVGRPLQQADVLIQKQQYSAALAKIAQANDVRHLTAYETLLIAQTRGIAAAGAGDYTQAAEAYETVLKTTSLPVTTQREYIQAISGFYYEDRDYKDSVIWVNRYISVGGNDPRTVALLPESYYQEGDYHDAEFVIWRDQKSAEASGQMLPLSELQLLTSCAYNLKDAQSYNNALALLLTSYPSKQYWHTAIDILLAMPNFPDRLTVEVYQLRFVTGTLVAAGDYEDFAERDIQAGDTQEAKAVIGAGFASGILTSETDEGHAQRLRILLTNETSASSQKIFDYIQKVKNEATTPDGCLKLAIAYYKAGDLQLAKQTILTSPDYAARSDADPTHMLMHFWVILVENGIRSRQKEIPN